MINILEDLERSAVLYPEKCALIDEKGALSYRELLCQSRRTASALLPFSLRCESCAVLMEKSIDTLLAFFGSVLAGGCYCLLNPALPLPRLSEILKVLKPRLIITDTAHEAMARELAGELPVLLIQELKESPVDEAGLLKVRARCTDTDPLYINFTSGSTGIPKGVVIEHRSVIDFMQFFPGLFGIGPEDILASQAPFDFDVSVKDIYSCLHTGACLVLIPKELFSAPASLLDYLEEQRVTTMIWAVSALCLISIFHGLDYKTPKRVNKVLFSGEVMPLKYLKDWQSHLPDALFVNLYGPTEITCNCTYHVIDPKRDYASGIPIGIPFPNEEVFLLNEQDQEVTAPDVPGQICVRGSALAGGYWHEPEQTAGRFRPDPRFTAYSRRIYATGDLAHYNGLGELVFTGRSDHQVKVQGHRIELAEVELAMEKVPGVERACCLFDEKRGRLIGVYSGGPEKALLHKTLLESLPEFMVPGILRQLPALPVTARGKIDRQGLREKYIRS